jgi:hypothetical protein
MPKKGEIARAAGCFALFDFDKTLSRGDSIIPYLFYCIRRGVAPASQFFRAFHG